MPRHGSEYFPNEAGPPRDFTSAFEGLKRKIQRNLNQQGVRPRIYARDESPYTAPTKPKPQKKIERVSSKRKIK